MEHFASSQKGKKIRCDMTRFIVFLRDGSTSLNDDLRLRDHEILKFHISGKEVYFQSRYI